MTIKGGLVRVLVATTEGPSVIQRVTEEDPEVRSVICLNGTTQALPISQAYEAFVRRPTGVVERAVGHPAFRTDVSHPIDDGGSWQLALYLAHILARDGRLAEREGPAETMLWVTGTVDSDLAVGAVDHVSSKLQRSREDFAAQLSNGQSVLVVVPEGNAAEVGPSNVPEGVHVVPVATVDDALSAIALEASKVPDPGRSPWRVPMLTIVAALVVAALLISPVGPLSDWFQPIFNRIQKAVIGSPTAKGTLVKKVEPVQPLPVKPPPMPAQPVFDPAKVDLVLVEKLWSKAGACGADAIERTVTQEAPSEPGVCRLLARVTNTGALPVEIWIHGALVGSFRSYARSGRFNTELRRLLAPGEMMEIGLEPPPWLRRALSARLVLMVGADVGPIDAAASSFGPTLSESLELRPSLTVLPDGVRSRVLVRSIDPR
ncbi:MAG: hypothetical protein HOL85_09040 [Rhodospirillaceae bacterium]|nr:hypothetical protein [Rhodospirillaceae bacterium]